MLMTRLGRCSPNRRWVLKSSFLFTVKLLAFGFLLAYFVTR